MKRCYKCKLTKSDDECEYQAANREKIAKQQQEYYTAWFAPKPATFTLEVQTTCSSSSIASPVP